MANLNGFNASEVDPQMGFEPIPAGKYLAVITESMMKPTKNNAGQYLQLTFQILEGSYKGRNIWAHLNLEHLNPETVKYARAELSSICRAVGVMAPKDSCDLHNIPLVIRVGDKVRKDTGEVNSVIKGYEPKAAAAPAPAYRPAPAMSNGPATAPWRR